LGHQESLKYAKKSLFLFNNGGLHKKDRMKRTLGGIFFYLNINLLFIFLKTNMTSSLSSFPLYCLSLN